MEQTARNVVRQIYEKYQLTGPFVQPEQPDVKKVMNNSKVTDHHAIIPTMELASCHLDELKSWEEKILFLIAVHAASWKDISGKSIGDDETKSKWNSCNLTWF